MKTHVSSRHIWATSLPVIFAGLSESVVEITDVILLGRYGTTELAAIGLADAIYGVCLFLTLGLVDGIQIVIARRAGQERPHEIGAVFVQGLYLLFLVAAGFVLVLKLFTPYVAEHLIRSGEVAHAVDAFLQIFAFAMLFHGFNLAFSAFYVGISRTRALVGATVVLAVVNITLDYLLIFGHHGCPELGIKGAAVGSLCAEIAAFLYLLLHAVARRYTRTYRLFRFARWDRALTGKLMAISSPVALDALVETVRWFAFFLIIEHLGENALAATNIVFSCYALFLIPVHGFAETACSMVSNLVGQGHAARINALLGRSVTLSYAIVAPLLGLTLLLPDTVLAIFTSDRHLIAASVDSLRVVVLAVVVVVPAESVYSAVVGTGDTKAGLVIEIAVSACVLCLAYVFLMPLAWPLATVWFAEIGGLLLCFGLAWGRLRSGRWQRADI